MNLLVTGAWSGAKDNIGTLTSMGHNVVFMQWETDVLPCEYTWVEGVICNGLFLSHSIEKFENLKYIQLTSVGFDRVPMDYVESHKIKINNARGVYSIPMAEFAIAGILQLYKQMAIFNENKKQGQWVKQRNLLELFGKTVCIVGCGSVGNEIAKRLKAFGCNILGVDLFPRETEEYTKQYGLECLNVLLPIADIVVLTLPLTNDTYHLMGKENISLMKKESILVNVARGAIVCTESLIEGLNSNLGGAVLDVFESEPLNVNSALWKMDNVVLTPHNSFVGEGNSIRLNSVIIGNLK